jgi:hypothetical protein
MEMWDMQMQLQCAKSFQEVDTILAINPANQIQLMEATINIIIGADIA